MALQPFRAARRSWFVVLVAMLLGLSLGLMPPSMAYGQKKKRPVASLIKKGQRYFDEQKYEESIQTLSAALMRPEIAKDEKISVYQMLAYNYILLRRTEEADGAVRGLLVLDESFELPDTESPRFRDFFTKVRKKWEKEGKPGLETGEVTPTSRVKIKHSSPAQVDPGAAIRLEGRIEDPDAVVDAVMLYYRGGTKGKFKSKKAKYAMSKFTVDIPESVVEPPLVEYYLEARDSAGLPVAARGDADTPQRIAVSDSGGVLSSPWFWIPVSVAVVAAVVIPVIIVSTSTTEAEVTVNVFE